jgi:peptidoglycan/xylan/chitin deacetylase (PgdA/CDA1 family)
MPASSNGETPVSSTLSLTFDDGPDPDSTPAVLATLARLGVRATFFMLGERIETAPGLARSVLDAGHDVQLHGYRHLRHSELDERQIEDDTRAALAVFAEIGVRPARWRTPWGVTTEASERIAARHGLALVGWTIDTHDWRGDDAATMLARAESQLAPGAVVLMHDALGPGSRRSDLRNTLELLAPLTGAARARGLVVGALPGGRPDSSALARALERVAAGAEQLDADPRFPREAFDALAAAGVTQLAADRAHCDLVVEASLVRAVARADASVARILDGHFNGVERLAMLADDELRERELASIASGELLLGVWGADPGPGEGPPARIELGADGQRVLRGVKTFCSGAGGVQRALVIARDEHDERRVAYLDTARGVVVDRSWYRASGLRASESHRVEFRDAPLLALLGGRDEIMREPWFSRDAVRTSATWAGIADRILDASVAALAGREPDELRLHALGGMRVARSSIDRWLEHAVAKLDEAAGEATAPSHAAQLDDRARQYWRSLAAESRLALSAAARSIAGEAVRVAGSRELVVGGPLDRARRDLDLFLLQHRLDPKLVELGAQTLAEAQR